MSPNKTISAQIISGILKFLAVAAVFLLVALIIPLFLSIVKGKDIAPVDDSVLQLKTINLPQEENAFYDLDKLSGLINVKNVPAGKQLVSDYLTSDQWNQGSVQQLLADNDAALQVFTEAAAKGNFQLPATDAPAKISRDIPVTPLNAWREASRLSGVKAISLAQNGQSSAAVAEAFKSIIIGQAIENSQSPLIDYLVGLDLKNNGLDTLQKVLSLIPQDSVALSVDSSQLAKYQAAENYSPLAIEYQICQQSWDNLGANDQTDLGQWMKLLAKNKFYFKKNLSISYCFSLYSQLATESVKDCSQVKNVQVSLEPLALNNPLKMYFTDNAVGKYYGGFYLDNETALNNVLAKKCAVENKLQETLVLINSKK